MMIPRTALPAAFGAAMPIMPKRLQVGRIRINGAPLDKRGTHGGFKLSGIGREWGRVGIEEFLEYKSVIG
ncbi:MULTISPECIES: aldehyde dehydrogenase family protein [unclassified Bradyrhizobium]|uniref:aldehyde dehydrogenase family protein n=1 Tax=unclassified Bradyrhizobium TaxID=2631580 RepID=UPI0004878D6B|nr:MULTISPECIES: aldehyde dehydrogenase family protein [unclassified Bradyrhizobium]MCP3464636.1 aldehyde dehydrogenase family protein [Bradyrhizobium sp. CCGUVB23]